jgi:hypothetical protein
LLKVQNQLTKKEESNLTGRRETILTIIVVDAMVCLVLLENMSETSSSLYILKEIEVLFSSKLFENCTYNGDLLVKWVFKLLA